MRSSKLYPFSPTKSSQGPMQNQPVDASKGHDARLAIIGPATASSSSKYPSSTSGRMLSNPRRNRLPPRSKSGCWTCRTRKVKCDEQRPTCTQCTRLGLACDYNPRLTFKDDTQRVVERMQDVSTTGNSVWNPRSSDLRSGESTLVVDLLPPFAALTTNEDRERKAESQSPGTYHVVTNPTSFSHLPEYRESDGTTVAATRRHSYSFPDDRQDDFVSQDSGALATEADPNVVVLRKFEDPPWRGTSQKSTTNPASPASSLNSIPRVPQETGDSLRSSMADHKTSMIDEALIDERDVPLLAHYRSTVSPNIFREASVFECFMAPPNSAAISASFGIKDVFEAQARSYPPLFHAMMALAALSLAHQNILNNADALEHYQKVIPALQASVQSTEDSFSDGAYFTHFLLLLYEIAAAENQESDIWQHHIDQLLRIIDVRHAHGAKSYDILVWTICSIDVHALLSFTGNGTFADTVLGRNMLPLPNSHQFAPAQFGILSARESSYFPAVLDLNNEILELAVRVGQTARDLRTETSQRHHKDGRPFVSEALFLPDRQARATSLQQLLAHSRDTWRSRFPEYEPLFSGPEPPPPRASAWIQIAYMLFRACMILAHTSLYPGQLSDQTPESLLETSTCASEVIQAAQADLSQSRFELQPIVLALFLAGFATKIPDEKEAALEMIGTIETYSFGVTTERTMGLLGRIFERQRNAVMQTGNANSVDWVGEMELSGERLVIYGL